MLIQHERRVMVRLRGGHLKCPWGAGQQISVAMTSELRSLRLHDFWGMRGQHSFRVLTHTFSAGLHLFWHLTFVMTMLNRATSTAWTEGILRKKGFVKVFLNYFIRLITWKIPFSSWLTWPIKSHLSIIFQTHDGLMELKKLKWHLSS